MSDKIRRLPQVGGKELSSCSNQSFETEPTNSGRLKFKCLALPFGKLNDRATLWMADSVEPHTEDFLRNGLICGINHDWEQQIGVPISARREGLFWKLEAEIFTTDEDGRNAAAKISEKASNGRTRITGVSTTLLPLICERIRERSKLDSLWSKIGYVPDSDDLSQMGSCFPPDTEYPYGVRVVREAKPLEVSPVNWPAFWNCRVEANGGGGFAPDWRTEPQSVRAMRARCEVNRALVRRIAGG